MKAKICFLVFVSLIVGSCDKLPNIPFYFRPTNSHEDSLNASYKALLLNKEWAISSIRVSPKINNVDTIPQDTCNKKISFNFFNDNYGNGPAGVLETGSVKLSYKTGLCKASTLPAGNTALLSYYIDIDSNKIHFPDNGVDGTKSSYTIARITYDSLLLSKKDNNYTYTKIYLRH